ncbi:MAG TPA: radical SAM protein [Acidimicrobiia bacterium]|jgi:radical SAM protein with 4Fe4S-binding SPASM domain|nr:radical SAM protein [Acidimicrobiia bacterium]
MKSAAVSVRLPGPPDLSLAGDPIAIQIEFTSRCQLRCRMCPLTTGSSSTSHSPGPMHELVFEHVLAIARRCRRVILAGYGEPLTNPECLPMLRALDAEGIDIAIATNGIALTPTIAEELVALEHVTFINISIDSPDPDVYHQVRGGNVERSLQGLRNLMAVVNTPDRVVVSSVAMATNLASLVEFPALLAELGVRRYALQAVMDYTDYAYEHRLVDHVELETRLFDIEAACIAHGIVLELSVPARTRADFRDPDGTQQQFYGTATWDEQFTRQCNVPWDIPFIDKDGGVFACCFAGSANERQLGRLGPETFDEIWSGPAARQFRRDILDGTTTPDICRRCSVAPLGRHPFRTWAATVVGANAVVRDASTATVSVSVLNTSDQTWTPDHRIHVATSTPRDTRTSPATHPAWLSPNRPATMREAAVAPGDVATFEFPAAVPRFGEATSEFELVADGTCWFPDTRFTFIARSARRDLRRTPVAALYRRVLPRPVRKTLARTLLRRARAA